MMSFPSTGTWIETLLYLASFLAIGFYGYHLLKPRLKAFLPKQPTVEERSERLKTRLRQDAGNDHLPFEERLEDELDNELRRR